MASLVTFDVSFKYYKFYNFIPILNKRKPPHLERGGSSVGGGTCLGVDEVSCLYLEVEVVQNEEEPDPALNHHAEVVDLESFE